MNTRKQVAKRIQSALLVSVFLVQQLLSVTAITTLVQPAQVFAAEDPKVEVAFDATESTLSFAVHPADSVDYELSYSSQDDQKELVLGTKEADNGTVFVELYVGTCSSNVCTPHTLRSGELKLIIEHDGKVQERTTSFTTANDVLWLKEGETYTTFSPVELDKEYRAPQNEKVVLTFTKLPKVAGSISFTEIKLSAQQKLVTNALSDTAYDITSDMRNGEFEYSLTLPLPENVDGNVAVKVAETPLPEDLKSAEKIGGEAIDVNDQLSTLNIKTLNHFTTFVIVDTTPVTSNMQVVTPSSTNWTSVQQNGATGTFTLGPGGPGSLGTGSYSMKLGMSGENKSTLGAPNVYNGQALVDLIALSYSFYIVSPGTPTSSAEEHLAPSLNLMLDLNGDNVYDQSLVYEPCYADPLSCSVNFRDNTWRSVDALTGLGWSYTGDIIGGAAQYQTLSYYLSLPEFADATLLSPASNQSALQIVAGQDSVGLPWNEYFEAQVDNVSIGFNSSIDIFDFEPGGLAAPLFWVEEQTSNIVLNWDSVPSATSYNVYRSTLAGGGFTQINGAPIVDNSYTDSSVTTGTAYYYKVTTVGSILESQLGNITPKYARALDFVIDDDSWQADMGATGTVSSTGLWNRFAVSVAPGLDSSAPEVLQHAVGGDVYSTGLTASGQTYSWTTSSALNGTYEVFAQYICDPSRGTARYRVYSGAVQVGSDVLRAQNVTASGTACGSQSSGNTESEWVSLGNFLLHDQARVEVVADLTQDYILADAVGFREVVSTSSDSLLICKEDASSLRLAGWTMYLSDDQGPSHTFTDVEVQSDQGYSFLNLLAGNYVVQVQGYYQYGDTAMIADAGYTYRPEYIPCTNTPGQPNPWVSNSIPCVSDILSVRLNDALPSWGQFNNSHVYQTVVSHPGGDFKVSITDNNYVDNNNSTTEPMRFFVYRVLDSGVTSDVLNGCAQFSNVQPGGYAIYEAMQSGWQRAASVVNDTVPTNGLISVVGGLQEFVFVNELVSPTPSPSSVVSPSPSVSPSASALSGGNGGSGNAGPVANNAQPPVCSAISPSGAPVVSIVETGVNTITLSWSSVSPVTHYGLYFRRNSDGAEYGATNIGNVNSYTVTNLSGQAAYTFELFGVNDCAPGPRGQVSSGIVGGAILTGRPTGPAGQVLGQSTESPSPTPTLTPSPSSETSNTPQILGTSDSSCTDSGWWWSPLVAYAIIVVVMAFVQSNNAVLRRTVALLGFGITAVSLYYWKCQTWPWIIGTGIGGAIVELFTTFLLSDDETEQEPLATATKQD